MVNHADDLRVALRYLDFRAPQRLLECEDISAVAQVRDREAVTKTMRVYIFHSRARANVLRSPMERTMLRPTASVS